MKTVKTPSRRRWSGYTLVEVLAAGAVIAVGMGAAAVMSGTLMTQEEMSWRTDVSRNYQENMARLWQLGISDSDVLRLMPTPRSNPKLAEFIYGQPTFSEVGSVSVAGAVDMDAATSTVITNASKDPSVEVSGATFVMTVYRNQFH